MRSAYEIRSLSSSKWCVRSAAVTLLQCTLSGFVRATQAFLKRTKKFLASGDNTLQYSECEDGRRKPSVLSEPYEKQLA